MFISKKQRAEEDYLEAIYLLSLDTKNVRLSDIAEFLKVSPASASEYMGKLVEKKYVSRKKYGAISLTSKGIRKAKNVHHRHVVLVSFLKNIIGVKPSVAEEEGCAMEHILSMSTIKKVEKFYNKYMEKKDDLINGK